MIGRYGIRTTELRMLIRIFRHHSLLVMLCLASLQAFAQGVPKAYESIYYQGKVNGHIVKFLLANGYIGASGLTV